MVLFILRGLFIVLVAAVILLYVVGQEATEGFQAAVGLSFGGVVAITLGTLVLAGGVVLLDAMTRQKKLSSMSGVFLGLLAGLLSAYALSFVVDLVGLYTLPDAPDERLAYENLLQGVKVIIGLITCYLGISLVLQTKDDFRFVIPYVEFAKQIRGPRPILLDTSVIIDGRILDIIDTRILQGGLLIPRFVLNELQTVADSADKLKRSRGRRGLDILQQLQTSTVVEVHIDDSEPEGTGVDQKLISLAEQNRGRIMTIDYNLNKVATLRGVEVININDLAKALRPVVLPGERMNVMLVKPGEGQAQAVGYLEDGTMIVVEEGRSHIGDRVELVVSSTLQTSAGRMIFGKYERTLEQPQQPQAADDEGETAASDSGDSQAGKSQRNPGGSSGGRGGRNPRRTK